MSDVFIREIQLGSTEHAKLIDVQIPRSKRVIRVVQNGNVVEISRWQALELAKELLNYREWLRRDSGITTKGVEARPVNTLTIDEIEKYLDARKACATFIED